MNLAAKIARRYLFSTRSTNAINIISGIAVFGVAIGAAALVLVLSVFNGFEDLFLGMYNKFNSDVTISLVKGKTFEADTTMMRQLYELDAIEIISQTLEEKALFDYKGNKDIGLLKGVDQNYTLVTGVDSTLREGVYRLQSNGIELAVVGQGLRNKLGIDIEDPFGELSIFMPNRKRRGPFDTRKFISKQAQPVGTFIVQQDFENQYVIASIDLARKLTMKPNACSQLEVKLVKGYDIPQTYEAIQAIVGEEFVVKNHFEQEASFLKLMRIEKWLSFAIVGLMMLLISFNLIGALWMIVLEKRSDIAILKSMGMTDRNIYHLFLYKGLFMCTLGLVIGFIIAIVLYILQKTVGIIVLPGGMLIDAYPVSMRWYDFVVVALVVYAIGLVASILPARRARRVSAIVHEG